jgi:chemotaxis protein MotB
LTNDLASRQSELDVLGEQLDAELEKSSRILADRGALRQEVADMKDAMRELQERRREAEARVAEFRQLVAQFRALIDAGTLEVKIVDGRMVVALATDVLFSSGSARLSEDGKAALSEVAAVLVTLSDRRFQIEGHTDDVPIKTERYPSNWYLASARALGVVTHLVDAGMSADQLSGASYAEFQPTASNETDEGRLANRRIEIVLVPDLDSLPGYEELEAL